MPEDTPETNQPRETQPAEQPAESPAAERDGLTSAAGPAEQPAAEPAAPPDEQPDEPPAAQDEPAAPPDEPSAAQDGQAAQDEKAAEGEEAQGEEAAEEASEYGLEVEDLGELKRKLRITVPAEKIDAKRDEMFGELSRTAQVPGFRVGRAPRRLIEKRFARDVAHDVRNAVVGESLKWVMEHAELDIIGQPTLDIEAIELPERGDLTYEFEAEVAPEFDLPELKGIEVVRPKVEMDPADVDKIIDEMRAEEARYEPTDQPARRGDMVRAQAVISGDGIDEQTVEVSLRVAAGQVEGLPLVDLAERLAGRRAGDTVEMSVEVPQAHPNEAWRGKQAKVVLRIMDVSHRVLPAADDEWARSRGYDGIQEMREGIASIPRLRLQRQADQSMREQLSEYLLSNTDFDLPTETTVRYAESLLRRRLLRMMELGIPQEQIEERMVQIRASVAEEARRTMKEMFIFQKIAEQENIEVAPEEINSRIAAMARLYGRRPERLKAELAAEGSLDAVADVIRDDKVIKLLLENAVIKDEADQPASETEQQSAETAEATEPAESAESAESAEPAESPEPTAAADGGDDDPDRAGRPGGQEPTT
ncbi:MAG: trigger factor [Planctomycetes bacterium]|nr:trigger factor [Planctomycetota bacterium]